jgi:hypothetical protein
MTIYHRLRQVMHALTAATRPVDYDLAAQFLSADQLALFQRMRRSEQLHSLNVLRSIGVGDVPPDLAVAALLHDVGKTCYPLTVWQKSLAVGLRAVIPPLFHRWSQGQPQSRWRRPFVVAAQHPAWSAQLAGAIGTSEAALWLIAHHADPLSAWAGHPLVDLLARLKHADDLN